MINKRDLEESQVEKTPKPKLKLWQMETFQMPKTDVRRKPKLRKEELTSTSTQTIRRLEIQIERINQATITGELKTSDFRKDEKS